MQNLSRRSLLRGAAAVPALFASSHTLALGSASDATSEPWDATASIGNSSGAVIRLSAHANALLESLDSAQRKAAWYRNLTDSARTRWSNFPAGASPRAGISIADLTDQQRILVHELLRASVSTQGYHKITGAIRADDELHDLQHDIRRVCPTLHSA